MEKRSIIRTLVILPGGFSKKVGKFLKNTNHSYDQIRILVFDKDRTDEEHFTDVEFPVLPLFSKRAYDLYGSKLSSHLELIRDDPGFRQLPALGLLFAVDAFLWMEDQIYNALRALRDPNQVSRLEQQGYQVMDEIAVFIPFGSGGGTGAGLIIPILVALSKIENLSIPLLVYPISHTPDTYTNLSPQQKKRAADIAREIFTLLRKFEANQTNSQKFFNYIDHSQKGAPLVKIPLHFLFNHFYVIPGNNLLSTDDAAAIAGSYINYYTHKITHHLRANEANAGEEPNIGIGDLLNPH